MGDEEKQGKPRFEPPPWEVEAFEALAAKRAEQEAEARAVAEALSAAAVTEAQDPQAPDGEPAESGSAAADPARETEQAAPAPARKEEPDSRLVQAMMLQLQREERSDGKSAVIVGVVAAGVTMALGVAMLIGGLNIARTAAGKSSAVIGSAVLSVFGLIFIGMAAWVWVTATRVKGR